MLLRINICRGDLIAVPPYFPTVYSVSAHLGRIVPTRLRRVLLTFWISNECLNSRKISSLTSVVSATSAVFFDYTDLLEMSKILSCLEKQKINHQSFVAYPK